MIKRLIWLLTALIFVLSGVMVVHANDADTQTILNIVCDGDVKKLNIEIIPAEACNETICIYVMKDDVDIEDITPENVSDVIIGIKELKPVDGVYSVEMKLRKGIEAGWYKVIATDYMYVAPEWKDSDVSLRSVRVYLADTALIDDAIAALNGATKNNINSFIEDEYCYVLNITFPSDYENLKDKIAEYLVLERKYVYEDSFESVAEIQNAYGVATLCAEIAKADAESLKTLIEKDKENLLSDIVEDFDAFADEVVRLFVKVRDSKVDEDAPCKMMSYLLRKATAVAALNMSSRADIPEIIEKYNDVLKLDLKGNYLKVDAVEVHKALSRMGFDSIEDVQDAFDARIKELLNKKQTTGGSGGSSFGGGSGSSKVEYEFTDNNKTEIVDKNEEQFVDMKNAQWASEYVEYLVERKIVNGDGTGNFRPNASVTREEFIKMIVLAFGLYDATAQADFDDVDKNTWYYPYIASAVKSGIIRGVDEKNFGIGKNITRQDIAVIANRVYDINGKNVPTVNDAPIFADYGSIADYAKESVVAMRDAGVINGFEDKTFKPADFATRAQAAKIIYVLAGEVIGL